MSAAPIDWTVRELAHMTGHLLMHPALNDEALLKGMAVAVDFDCAAICIKPYYVATAAKLLRETGIVTATVIGYPYGSADADVKLYEACHAMADGAGEIGLALNTGKIRSGDWSYVEQEIAAVKSSVEGQGGALMAICEMDLLEMSEIETLCRLNDGLGLKHLTLSFRSQESPEWAQKGAVSPVAERVAAVRRLVDTAVELGVMGVDSLPEFLAVRRAGATRILTAETQRILSDAAELIERGDAAE